MRYKITGRNINVTPGLKAAVEEKIGKLERYFNQDTEVNITLTVEKDRGYHPCQRHHHPCRAGKQRYVCID